MSEKINKCRLCGGKCENGICIHCGARMPDSEYSIEYIKDYYKNVIFNKIVNFYKLDEKENAFLNYILMNVDIKESCFPIHFVLKGCLLKKQVVDYENFELIMKQFILDCMNSINGDRIKNYLPFVEFVPELFADGIEAAGATFGIKKITITNDVIKNLYDGSTNSLIVIFHEVSHVKENMDIFLSDITTLEYRVVKDQILKYYYGAKNVEYYRNNYDTVSSEIYARTHEKILMLKYLQFLGLETLNYDQMIGEVITDSKKYKDDMRMINIENDSKQCELDLLFEQIIFENPEYLDEYPVLKHIFINENGIIRKKNSYELSLELVNCCGKTNLPELIKNLIIKEQKNRTSNLSFHK